MSRVLANQLSRLEKVLGLAGDDDDVGEVLSAGEREVLVQVAMAALAHRLTPELEARLRVSLAGPQRRRPDMAALLAPILATRASLAVAPWAAAEGVVDPGGVRPPWLAEGV